MVISLRNPFILGPVLLIVLIIETILLKKHYLRYICAYIGVNIIPIIGVIFRYIYNYVYMVDPGLSRFPLVSFVIFLFIVLSYFCLFIYFSIKILIKLIKKEKLRE